MTEKKILERKQILLILLGVLLFTISISCSLPKLVTTVGPQNPASQQPGFLRTISPIETQPAENHNPQSTIAAILPTPNQAQILPTLRVYEETYIIRTGDTITTIAARFGIGQNTLAAANNLKNPEQITPGQELIIPPPDLMPIGPDFKIIPDSELVYSPSSANFDISNFVKISNGYLASYQEELDGQTYSGAEVIQKVSWDFSVNPRTLLALLEHQSGWVTQANPEQSTLKNPLVMQNTWRTGLYHQLIWAANQLNHGYYYWKINAVSSWITLDEKVIPPSNTINSGTAAVQYIFSQLHPYEIWQSSISVTGFQETYRSMFDDPFMLAIEPLTPQNLEQPKLQLPFESGVSWALTGGPHGGWGNGSAWAALDFAPPGDALGCVQNDSWVTASADGLVLRSDRGVVLQDIDGNGIEQIGWSILYLHIETRDRVPVGTYLRTDDRIGHPSCEGGVSTGTHVHIARKYNGEWISADRDIPFNLNGWIAYSSGLAYNGYLKKGDSVVQAYAGRKPENQIQH